MSTDWRGVGAGEGRLLVRGGERIDSVMTMVDGYWFITFLKYVHLFFIFIYTAPFLSNTLVIVFDWKKVVIEIAKFKIFLVFVDVFSNVQERFVLFKDIQNAI